VIEPYAFVRGITIALGFTWTATAVIRTVRFARRWERRLVPLGFERRWIWREVAHASMRVTVLDPLNLFLMCLLGGLWFVRGVA
jgi:hypothetical protein